MMTSTAAELVVKPLRDTLIQAVIATVALGGALIVYASLVSTGVPPELAHEVRGKLVGGALMATFCMIPGLLFLARAVQWWRRRGPHPSAPLALLAAVALYPLIFCLLIVLAY